MKFFALALALLFTPSLASAEDYSLEMWLSWYDGIHVTDPSDKVRDGCWPSPAGTTAVVEKELLSLNVPLVSVAEASKSAMIRAEGMGWTTLKQGEGYCAVRYKLTLWGKGGPEGGYSAPFEASGFAGLYLKPKSESQAYMDGNVKSDATRIAVAWVKSRKIREERDKRLAASVALFSKRRAALPKTCRKLTEKMVNDAMAWYLTRAANRTTLSDFTPLLED